MDDAYVYTQKSKKKMVCMYIGIAKLPMQYVLPSSDNIIHIPINAHEGLGYRLYNI